MTVGPSWMPRRRWRAGIQVYVDLSVATVMVALGVVTFVGHGRGAPLALEIAFRLVGLLGLAHLAHGVNGLRPVRIDGDRPVLSIPTYSLPGLPPHRVATGQRDVGRVLGRAWRSHPVRSRPVHRRRRRRRLRVVDLHR